MSIQEIKNKSLNVDSPMYYDSSISQILYRRYNSDTTVTDNTTDIVISVRDVNEYFSLKKSYLLVRGRFASIGGQTLSAVGAKVALENGATSLFSQSRLRVQNQLVEDNQALSHQNAFVKKLTTHSRDYLDNNARIHGWALDTTPELDEVVANEFSTFNKGYVKRRQDAGAVVSGDYPNTNAVRKEYSIPLSDLFSSCDVDRVLKGVSLKIELSLRSALERMFQVSTLDTFNVDGVDLMLAIIQPSFEVLGDLESRFSSNKPISYNYVNYKTYESPVVASPTQMSYTFQIQQQRPLGVFVGVQQVAGSTSNFHNSMSLDKANVSRLNVRVNGHVLPYENYQPGFATGEWTRVYEELTRFGTKNDMKNASMGLTPEEWFKVVPIYWIDFNNIPEASSYQILLETSHSSAPSAVTVGGDANARSANCKFLMTTLSLAEFTVNPQNGFPIVMTK